MQEPNKIKVKVMVGSRECGLDCDWLFVTVHFYTVWFVCSL
jgi:hypothetical protein